MKIIAAGLILTLLKHTMAQGKQTAIERWDYFIHVLKS